MRRVVAMVLTALVLTSCARKEALPVTSGFVCTAEVSFEGTAYRGTFEAYGDGNVRFSLTEPSTVSGLVLTFSNERLTATFGGMELVLSDSRIPAASVIPLLAKALEQVSKLAATDPSCEVQGELDGVAYTLQFDRESGMPTALSVPEYALSVSFFAWQNTL